MYRRWAKRVLDLIVAVPTLLLLTPVLGIIALCVRFKLGAPVLFRQPRPGLHGHSFTLYKFRTMIDARDGEGNLLPDSARLTPFGRLLRSSSLDELPELWNVLKGDMSLVGPRPLRTHYLPLYTAEQARRHDVKPGITGWAQVNGRNQLTWEQRFELDVWYVDNISFKLDMRIVVATIKAVLKREGISAEGEVTMYPFTGESAEEMHCDRISISDRNSTSS